LRPHCGDDHPDQDQDEEHDSNCREYAQTPDVRRLRVDSRIRGVGQARAQSLRSVGIPAQRDGSRVDMSVLTATPNMAFAFEPTLAFPTRSATAPRSPTTIDAAVTRANQRTHGAAAINSWRAPRVPLRDFAAFSGFAD